MLESIEDFVTPEIETRKIFTISTLSSAARFRNSILLFLLKLQCVLHSVDHVFDRSLFFDRLCFFSNQTFFILRSTHRAAVQITSSVMFLLRTVEAF